MPRLGLGYFEQIENSLRRAGVECSSSWNFPRRGIVWGDKYTALHLHMLDCLFGKSSRWRTRSGFLFFRWILRPFLRLRKIRLIWTCHEFQSHSEDPWLQKQYEHWTRWFAITSDEVIAHSEVVEAWLVSRRKGPVHLIPHGDLSACYEEIEARLPEEVSGMQGRLAFVAVGIIRKNKGLELVVEAFQQAAIPGSVLVVAGTSEDRDLTLWIKSQSKESLPITLVERPLTTGEVIALHQWAYAVVFGFTRCHTSGSLMTAMSLSSCIVAPGIGHAEEILRDGGAELFDPDAAPASMVKALRRVAASAELASSYRQEGKKRAKAQDWDDIARRTIILYGENPS